LDKLKPKVVRPGEPNVPIKVALAPQLPAQLSSSSVRAPVKTELVKSAQSGSLQVLSREQNGTVNTVKDSISSPVSPVLGRSSSMEPMRKPVNQKLKVVTNGLPLHILHGSFGERKASAKDKHKFFELLRSKSVNGSSTASESPSSLIDDQQNSRLALSLYNSGAKFLENGSSSCEEANSCEGSHRHLSDNEEVIPPPSESRDVLDEGSLGILVDNRDASSSAFAGTEDIASKKSQPDISAYIDGVSMMSNSVKDDAKFPFVPIIGEKSYPAQELEHMGAGEEEPYAAEDFKHIGTREEELYFALDKPSPEELAFLRSLGWDENEVVPPLQQEEIADCVSYISRLVDQDYTNYITVISWYNILLNCSHQCCR
jgi:hypothetical protein